MPTYYNKIYSTLLINKYKKKKFTLFPQSMNEKWKNIDNMSSIETNLIFWVKQKYNFSKNYKQHE